MQGKVALVTGGGRGIGKSVALELAREGARVAVNSRTPESCQAVSQEISSLGGISRPYVADVGKSAQVKEMVSKVLEDFGAIHLLVNNAGVARDSLLLRMKEEDWEEVLNVNLHGTFLCTREVAKVMLKQKEGRIVNISSIIGLTGNPGQANYAASKAGIIGFTRSVARELASRGITVNAIAPGYIQTEMTGKLADKVREELLSRIPMGRLGEPEDVAGVVTFLASPQARYITGQVICVDGGMVMS